MTGTEVGPVIVRKGELMRLLVESTVEGLKVVIGGGQGRSVTVFSSF